jgi:hypothetical protein
MTGRHHHRDDKTPLGWAWYGRLHRSHHPKEDTDVLPPPCDRMDSHSPDALAPFEPATSDGLGPVEPRHGAGPLLCADGRQGVPGHVAGPQRACRPPAVARVLLRGQRQPWGPTLRARRGTLLCAAVGLGPGPMGGHPVGLGPRGHDLGPALDGLGNSVRLNFCMVVELSDTSGQYERSIQLPWPSH